MRDRHCNVGLHNEIDFASVLQGCVSVAVPSLMLVNTFLALYEVYGIAVFFS